jgi:long-chain acyl-CoA synthetase
MLGYWNNPELTNSVVRDGWMRSGDVGYLAKGGYLYIVDRLKDMIITGGENVYSSEVEKALLSYPGVAMCAIIGIPDQHWGERVHAIVVRQPGSVVTELDLISHCKSLIAGYKSPRSIEFRAELPLSPAGKILKHALREPYWRDHGRHIA